MNHGGSFHIHTCDFLTHVETEKENLQRICGEAFTYTPAPWVEGHVSLARLVLPSY